LHGISQHSGSKPVRYHGGSQETALKGVHVRPLELALLAMLFLQGCATTIGRWDQTQYEATDFGPWRSVNVCMYRDAGVPPERARQLLGNTIDEWKRYNVELNIIDRGEMKRQGFWHNELIDQIDSVPLTSSCDRVFWLVNRNTADYLYADGPAFLTLGTLVAMPEVLGEVDDPTMTHGWAVAYGDSLNTLLMRPAAVVRHEFFHLIGSCPHSATMDVCYERIAELKHSQGRAGWYPSIGIEGEKLLDRQEANHKLAAYHDSFLP
jgi:hypothetical protein